MKKSFFFLTLVWFSLIALAQTPQAIRYQTVARNNAGEILASQNITFQMTIMQGELPGTVVYTETHSATTNASGLATLEIGRGTPVTGSFATINWSTTPIFLKTEIDPAGGSAFFVMGTSELLSVPFSLNSASLVLTSPNGKTFEVTIDDSGNLATNCFPDPTQANAGPDQLNLAGTSTTLQGNTPDFGTGHWTIISGIGGSIANPASPTSSFSGQAGNSYILNWIITTACSSSTEDITISFASSFACGQSITDIRDSKVYTTVQIGSQCWMAQNLNVGMRINGNSSQANNTTIEKYCYNNSEAQCDVYGGLYQWNEMMGYTTTAGVQGICPEGWHLPTDEEWCTLEQAVDPTIGCSSTGLRGVIGGGMLKESGTSHWSSPNAGASNSYGFTAIPGGYRNTDMSFYNMGNYGRWWSSSLNDFTSTWSRYLNYNNSQISRESDNKSAGYTVRCLKDNGIN